MIPTTLGALAGITGGRLHGCSTTQAQAITVDGPVVTDSREAGPGSLYVARIGESADGHDFVPGAAERGAVAALTTRPVDALPCVVVDDEQAGFVALARHLVDSSPDLKVIGITGSSGKTSTKDLLGSVLTTVGETVAPIGSYNSEVGVPLTVCRITPTTDHLVVELGARGIGHIDYLTRIAPPRIGIVLNVGHAHVGEFGSVEAIAQAKGELPASLPADGVAVLNADDPLVAAMAQRTSATVVLVGESDTAQVRAVDVTLDELGAASFTVQAPFGSARVRLSLVGRHHVGNALAVIAAAHAAGMTLEQIVPALAAARPVSRWRMEVTRREDGVVIVNDAYNANPDSMSAALRSVAGMATTGRRWAVLGTMLELGDDSARLHTSVGREAAELGFDEILVVGESAAPIAAGAGETGARDVNVRVVPDTDAAEAVLAAELATPDIAVFKSSRDAGLRWLGDRIVTREARS
ncbi:UDP-N-acetylmuramoyl-tripeptide--D-alanyl-D-alanine ligase [Janibacter sp. Soil728]|uniref:UDP-N-acetylmuramoyl-tripeptide--D-alanyl-D- alanine ligase n=1 Tax=Janibacter sp. Soil728 TaxID=1736393 RepID=UPI0006F942F5|nr:UDP-N-acetylmuramoyl-tripeptide--D-alanyl-D-alanine ligase [Janibacter sp. Soil728]KRE38343.1 UDP-N-acetylmuramoyl-tripeptide--D-alanyl-D-alanine ligase [Janibacter sp. Soil728]